MDKEQFWDDDKVIDFVNWYVDLHKLGIRYKLENQTIIDSFKNGDDPSVWHRELFKENINKMDNNDISFEEIRNAIDYLYEKLGFLSLEWTLEQIVLRVREDKKSENDISTED